MTQISERQAIERLAKEVPAGGLIVEIGTLYGGMTAVLALANPKARIITIDDFSWHPPDDTPASAGRFKSTMIRIGVDNVQLMVGNSREIGKAWEDRIDLLWVDGGHSYECAHDDLENFGKHAGVIAIHDYGNPHLKETVFRAVHDYISAHPCWRLDEVVHTTAILKAAE